MAVVENTTGRLAIRYPTNANNGTDFSTGIADLATDTDAKIFERSYGKSIIATTETRTNTAMGLMPTPDRVTVVLPTDGLIQALYQATWQESVQGAAFARLVVGANAVSRASATAAPASTSATINTPTPAATDVPLATYWAGLASMNGIATGAAYTGDVTTGQAVGGGYVGPLANGPQGGPCYIFATAGTYDITVQFAATSGNVIVKNRRLWVWSMF